MKKSSGFPYIMVVGCIVFFVIAGLQAVKNPAPTGSYSLSIKAADYTVQGPPTVSAAFINSVLAQAGSPAAGEGAAIYASGVKYGLDPVYALAFFHHESTYGTTGEATVTRSPGNERCIPDRPCNGAGFAVFANWLDGFEHWYSLIANLYIGQWHLATVEAIIPRYAPSSDGNNEAAYITAVEQDVVTWRAQAGGV